MNKLNEPDCFRCGDEFVVIFVDKSLHVGVQTLQTKLERFYIWVHTYLPSIQVGAKKIPTYLTF